MSFQTTTHLQDILESSKNNSIIIFKYSNSCKSSDDLKKEFEVNFNKNLFKNQIYLVTVQTQKSLSQKIEEYFNIKHESPQIVIIKNGKILYNQSHRAIKIEDLLQFTL